MAAVTQLAPSSAASNAGQGPRSVAPVLEYICLFTHDLKRKQKRWQDGRLKYHTFNKRIMVYDERGNFIGDSHWREDYDFGEGEELQLERGSVMVEVAECVGSTQQDLTELVDKRVQEKAERQSAAAARHAGSRAPSQSGPLHSSPAHAQQGHRPLQNMLGTPSGHYGRAVVPSESPYELKQREQADAKQDGPRPAKRRREDMTPTSSNQGYARNLFGAPLNLSARPMSSAPVRHNPRKVLQTRRDESPPLSSDPKTSAAEDEGPKKPERVSASRHLGGIPSMERNGPEPNLAPSIAKFKTPKSAEPRSTFYLNAPKGKSREDPIAIGSVDRRQAVQGADHPDFEQKIDKRMAVSSRADRSTVSSNRMKSNPADCEPNHDTLPPEEPQKSTTRGASSRSLADDRLVKLLARASKESPSLDKAPGQSITETSNTKEPNKVDESTKHYIELIIEPRKKRGLLMLADQGPRKKTRKTALPEIPTPILGRSSSALASENPDSDTQGSNRTSRGDARETERTKNEEALTIPPNKSTRKTNAVATAVETTVKPPTNRVPETSRLPVTGLSKPPSHALEDNLPGLGDEDTNVRLYGENQTRVSNAPYSDATARNTRFTSPSSSDDAFLVKPVSHANSRPDRVLRKKSSESSGKPHPTLAKLSRTSIRSREIIDFPSDDEFDNLSDFIANTNARHAIEQKNANTAALTSDGPISPEDETATAESGAAEGSAIHVDKSQGNTITTHKRQEQLDMATKRRAEQEAAAEEAREKEEAEEREKAKQREDARQREEAKQREEVERQEAKLREEAKQREEAEQRREVEQREEARRREEVERIEAKLREEARLREAEREARQREEARKLEEATQREEAKQREKAKQREEARQREEAKQRAEVKRREEAQRRKEANQRREAHQREETERREQEEKEKEKEKQQQQEAERKRREEEETRLLERSANHKQPAKHMLPSFRPLTGLSNPATRGKKAARPTDAAGQVPESLLPSEQQPMQPRPPIPTVKPITETARERSSALPGFSTANGGPWSREAYDLFAFTKPR